MLMFIGRSASRSTIVSGSEYLEVGAFFSDVAQPARVALRINIKMRVFMEAFLFGVNCYI